MVFQEQELKVKRCKTEQEEAAHQVRNRSSGMTKMRMKIGIMSIIGIIGTNTLWLFNIAMENGPFIDGLPIRNGDFPWLC